MSTKLIALLVFCTGCLQVSASESREARLKRALLIADVMEIPWGGSKKARFNVCIIKDERTFDKSSLSLRIQRADSSVIALKATEARDMKIRDYSATFKSCDVEDTRGPVKAAENFRRLADLYALLPGQESQKKGCSIKRGAVMLPLPNPKQKGGESKKIGNRAKRRLDFEQKDEKTQS